MFVVYFLKMLKDPVLIMLFCSISAAQNNDKERNIYKYLTTDERFLLIYSFLF